MVNLSLLKCRGVIIKTQDYKETDKIVWLYTDKYGKLSCIAKGAKRSKNKLFSITSNLCYGDFVFFKGSGMARLSEGRIIKSFQGLMDNLEKLIYGSYVAELVDIAVLDEEQNFDLFKEFITCLYLLDTDALDYELLVRSFELKLLKATGYGLDLDHCSICKKKISVTNYISLSYYGGVCENCKREHGLKISKGAYNAIRFLSSTPSDKIYKLNLSEEIKKEVEKVTTAIISSCYSKKPKSLEMFNYLRE